MATQGLRVAIFASAGRRNAALHTGRRNAALGTLLGALAAMGFAACASAAPAGPGPVVAPVQAEASRSVGEVHKRGTGKLIAEVGPRGGTLELSNGARLSIPAGALSEVVEVTLAEGAHTTAFSNHEYERPIGPIVEVSPELSLNTAAVLSVPLGALPEGFSASDLSVGVETVAASQRVVQGAATQTRWDYLSATASAGRASAELPALPGYRVQFVVSRSN
jgi:ZU5 domain